MTRILTVCTGNVCRSPLVERLLQRSFDEAFGSGAVTVASAGTGPLVDAPMDERSADILQELGGDPAGHLGRRITPAMVEEAALILTATRDHRRAVVQLSPRALRRTFTVRELAHVLENVPTEGLPDEPGPRLEAVASLAFQHRGVVAVLDGAELDVVDPYRRPDEVYAQMRDQLEPAMATLTRVLAPAPA